MTCEDDSCNKPLLSAEDDMAASLDESIEELFARSSLGIRGARDLILMTPEEVADALLRASPVLSPRAGLSPNQIMRATAVRALGLLRSARERSSTCWRCGTPQVTHGNTSHDDSLVTRTKKHLVGPVVAGSVAYDRIMRYPGLFSAQLASSSDLLSPAFGHVRVLQDGSDRLLLSINAKAVSVRRGGIAANICYGLTQLGFRPIIISAVGADSDDVMAWLESNGVDTQSVLVDERGHTPRFDCVADEDDMQVATFYEGTGARESEISLRSAIDRLGAARLILITSSSTEAMLRHTGEARSMRLPFVIDPSQRLRDGLLNREQLRDLLDGAAYLVCNAFERRLVEKITGWSSQEILDKVTCLVTTMGAGGVRVETSSTRVEVPAAAVRYLVDTTGVGCAFRAGFFGGMLIGLSYENAARLGCVLSALNLESVGTQEYSATLDEVLKRLRESYGSKAEETVAAALLGVGLAEDPKN